jgi:hypothetical protein
MESGLLKMNRKISLLLFFGMFLLVGSFGFVSAEKMWNFNNHSLNVSDNIFSGGDINVTSGGDVCIVGGMCLSEAGTGSGNSLWNESGSYLYPADLSKNVGIGTDSPGAKLNILTSESQKSQLKIENTRNDQGADASILFSNLYNNFTVGLDEYSSAGNMGFSISGSGHFNTNNYFFIDGNSGDVGIGTDNPLGNLHIEHGNADTNAIVLGPSTWSVGTESAIAWKGGDNSNILAKIAAEPDATGDWNLDFYTSSNWEDLTNRMRITDNGKVGIGTTSPTEMLTLNGSSPTGYPTISLINTINPSEWHIWPIDAGDLRIRDDTNSLDVMTFDQGTGRVGIGTTGPTYDLDVSGNGRFTSDLVVQGDVGIGDTTPNKPLEVKGVARVSRIGYDQNYIDIESPSTYQRISSSNNLLIDSGGILSLQPTGGYVGIGIDPPLYDLDVSGTGYFSNAIGVGVDPSSTYSIYANNGRAYGIRAHGSTMGGRFEDSGGTSRTYAAYGNYGIYTNLGSMNYFLGDVGIGITSPTVALDVSGAGEFTSSVTASAFYYSSDKELKMDVKKINSALEDIKKLEGIEFKWKENGEKSYGLIAQDVEKIYPELVGTREVFNETTNETKTYKTVQYGNLVAPLIESVKELDEKDSDLELEIRNLEEEVMGQEKRIEELERELDELKKLVLNGQEDLLN